MSFPPAYIHKYISEYNNTLYRKHLYYGLKTNCLFKNLKTFKVDKQIINNKNYMHKKKFEFDYVGIQEQVRVLIIVVVTHIFDLNQTINYTNNASRLLILCS